MEETKTKSDEDTSDVSGYEEVLQKSEELKQDYYERRTDNRSRNSLPRFNIGTWMTGLTTGEVIDVTIDENEDVILEVRLKDGGVSEVTVRNWKNKYNDQNEIVRLLEYMGIKEGNIGELLGEDIPLKISRYALPSNEIKRTEWKVYVPRKFDTIGKLRYKLDIMMRYVGYEGEFQGKLSSVGFLIVSLLWWVMLVSAISTGIIATNELPVSITSTLFISVLVSMILTIYTPMIMRGIGLLKEKYVEFRSKETVLED